MKCFLKISIMCGIVLCGVCQVNAYLVDKKSAENTFTYGCVETEIVETFDKPDSLKKGDSFTKDVRVKNIGKNDCFVRIKPFFSNSEMKKKCTINFNTTDYEYCEADGFYYYKNILTVGETTESLMTTVNITDDIGEEMVGQDIIIYEESYQTEGMINGEWRQFEGYKEAWNHFTKE